MWTVKTYRFDEVVLIHILMRAALKECIIEINFLDVHVLGRKATESTGKYWYNSSRYVASVH